MESAATADREIRVQAIAWYVRLCSGEATEAERQACRRWLDADPVHRLAWTKVAGIGDAVRSVPGHLALPALQSAERGRRAALRRLAGLASLGAVALLGAGALRTHGQAGRLRTATGERRRVVLEDGSELWLGTATEVELGFDARQRRIRLLAGEVRLQTAHRAGERRPLRVETAHGGVLALGTRFLVGTAAARSEVTVLEHAVEIAPRGRPSPARRLDAGWRTAFDARGILPPVRAAAHADAWVDGRLVVDDRPLAEVIAELARHRRGWLRCDPAVAGIRVSGVYPLDDPDLALQLLARRFPLRLRGIGGWWTVVAPA